MDVGGKPYLYYLIPGLLAMTTMRNSHAVRIHPISVMRLHEKSFGMLFFIRPPGCICLVAGHILAGAPRMYSGVFILVLGLVSGAGLGAQRLAPHRGCPLIH